MISIVIPTYNEEEYLPECLKALRSSGFSDYEVIIVDGHSNDRTIEIAKKEGCTIFSRERNGIADARNYGAEKATGEIVAFLDADSVPCANWLDIIEKTMTEDILAVGGPTYYGSILPDLLATSIFIFNPINKHLGFWYFSGNNVAYRKKFLLENGGFKKIECEDVELSKRLSPYYRYFKFINDMKTKLSERRFKKLGFFKTLHSWSHANMMIFLGRDKDPGNYSEVIR